MTTPGTEESREEQPQELAPLNIIRSETVLSKLPIHNLAKKGRVDIQINKKNDQGEIELRWEVSYNERYGQARQLAYKLDTIVINRRIDEEGRPLPKQIKLGSLRDICKDLGIPAGGNHIKGVKRAMFQNAFAAITAKLKYTATDRSERTLEAGFTRYSVVFTGEKLPDGGKADAVYIVLNDPYWEVLNNAPMRPLNYDYLKALPPAPQRFYEIISYRIFAALKYKHPYAKLAYSEYCTFSAQQRYYDYDHFKKQMYKVHVPHLRSGYLSKVHYEETTDSDGNTDWLMHYIPGPKAHAEYRAFNRGTLNKLMDVVDGAPVKRKPKALREQGRGEGQPEITIAPQPQPTSENQAAVELVQHFHQTFHKRENFQPHPSEVDKAAELLSRHSPEKSRFIVDFAMKQATQTNFRMEHFGAILKIYEQPGGHEFEKDRQAREELARQRARAAAEEAEALQLEELKEAYREHCRQQVDEHLATHHPAGTLDALIAARKEELRRLDWKRYQFWLEDAFTSFVAKQVYKEIAATLTIVTFEVFCQQQGRGEQQP